MLSYFQAIVLGLFQGLTELFPVSSLGHSVLLPPLLGWRVDEANDFFLIFLVATHFATACALLIFFFRDWVLIVKGFFYSLVRGFSGDTNTQAGGVSDNATASAGAYGKLAWLIIIGTVPAGIIGLLFQSKLQTLFSSPRLVAVFLIGNGLLLWGIENMSRKNADREELTRMTWWQSAKIGVAQALALIPGFSRTGATMAGGRATGLSHEAAAYFAFLLATPIIFAAAVLKLPELGRYATHGGLAVVGPILIGALAAFAAAYLSARFLVRYFRTKTLMPFAVYCIAAGIVASVLLAFHI